MSACKNQKPAIRGVMQSGGRNEKPRQHWCVAGYPLLLTAGFASILGGIREFELSIPLLLCTLFKSIS